MTSALPARRRLLAVDADAAADVRSRLELLAPFDGQLAVPDLRTGLSMQRSSRSAGSTSW